MADDADLRARVVAAATDLIRREGIGAATFERVARESGVRERQVRRLFEDIDDLRLQALSVPQMSEVAQLVAAAADAEQPPPALAILVEAAHRLFLNPSANWSDAVLEALVRARTNPELRDLAAERVEPRLRNTRRVLARGVADGAVDPELSQAAMTHFLAAMSLGLALLDGINADRPSIGDWDALIARLGVVFAPTDPAVGLDPAASQRWRLLIDIPERPRALSRLVRALGALNAYVNEVRVEQGRDSGRTIFLGLTAPTEVSADVILATAASAGTNGYIALGSPDDARDLMTRTLDGAAYLVKNPAEAPRVAARLVAADSYEVLDASEGLDDQPGLLRLQWLPHRHVLLRRDWCPFTRSEQARASALLRLSAAIGRMSGDEEPNGWVDSVKGGTVWIRLARPEDAEAVAAMHERCSERTRYLRYFSGVEWRDLQMRRLAGGHRGATLVAMSRDGLIIGLGNVFPEEDAQLRTAEIAVLVEDAHQGEGVGRALMARMLQMAQRLGFEQVSAHLFANNAPIRKLLESTGLKWTTRVSEGIADMTATLPVEPTVSAEPTLPAEPTVSDGAAAAPEGSGGNR